MVEIIKARGQSNNKVDLVHETGQVTAVSVQLPSGTIVSGVRTKVDDDGVGIASHTDFCCVMCNYDLNVLFDPQPKAGINSNLLISDTEGGEIEIQVFWIMETSQL